MLKLVDKPTPPSLREKLIALIDDFLGVDAQDWKVGLLADEIEELIEEEKHRV